jgi:hypothetical protein
MEMPYSNFTTPKLIRTGTGYAARSRSILMKPESKPYHKDARIRILSVKTTRIRSTQQFSGKLELPSVSKAELYQDGVVFTILI